MAGDRKRNSTRKPIRKDDDGGRAANIAGLVVMGVFVLIALLSILRIRFPLPDLPLPAQLDSTAARMLLAGAGLFLLFMLMAAAWKWWEVRKASSWPSVAGRITRSRSGVEDRPVAGDGPPVRTPIADIEFEYEVGGALYAGNRVSLAERMGADEIAAALERYPVGHAVMVHYDPKDPADSVLEPGLPPGAPRGCLIALAAGIAIVLFLMRVATEGPAFVLPWLQAAFPDADFPIMLFLLVMSAGFLVPAAIMARAVMEVRGWPAAEGVVLSTRIRVGVGGGSARAHYPIVTYRYVVDGVARTKSNLSHAMETGGGRGWAEKILARYPVGGRVEVRYDPADPERTSLETSFGFLGWLLAGIGLALLSGALLASGWL